MTAALMMLACNREQSHTAGRGEHQGDSTLVFSSREFVVARTLRLDSLSGIVERPVDLVVTEKHDSNGLPLNPRWGFQPETTGVVPGVPVLAKCRSITANRANVEQDVTDVVFGDSTCTSQKSLVRVVEFGARQSVPASLGLCRGSDPRRIHGHVNWLPVTYTGLVRWEDAALDGDINLLLDTDHHYGYTSANDALDLEFAFGETVARMVDGTSRWRTLNSALTSTVDGGGWALLGHPQPATLGEFFQGNQRAIVTGLYGLDAVHEFHAEIHPVWAIAINTAARTTGRVTDEVWSVFVRNMGDEGMCGSGWRPYLGPAGNSTEPTFSHTIRIDWPGVEVDSIHAVSDSDDFRWHNGTRAPVTYRVDRAVGAPALLVTFTLPRPRLGKDGRGLSGYALVYGDVHVHRWNRTPPKRGPAPRIFAGARAEEGTPEATLRQEIRRLPSAQQKQLMAALNTQAARVPPPFAGPDQLPRATPESAQVRPLSTRISVDEAAVLPVDASLRRRDSISAALLCAYLRPRASCQTR